MPLKYAHIVHAATEQGPRITGYFPVGHDVHLEPGPPHELLNTAAAAGWELVSVTADPGPGAYFTHFWLKREAQ